MHVTVEPPLAQWSIGDSRRGERDGFATLICRAADSLGSDPLTDVASLIATGHQAALWHPGILAKDLAVAVAARRFGTGMCHVVVDQDVHETMRLDLPINSDGRLSVESIELAAVNGSVPTGSQPPVDVQGPLDILDQVRKRHGSALAADVQVIADALRDLPDCRTLAEQVAALTERLMRPYVGSMPLVFASDLLSLPAAAELVEQMLADLPRCARCYNEAAAHYPDAGVGPLAVEPDRIELPLWLLRFNRPRLRVYGRLANSGSVLVDQFDTPIEPEARLAPRAIMLTALMRSFFCDLFVHGRGGWIYDRVTERWMDNWLERTLAPMAMVTADVHLDFDAPRCSRAELEKALWWASHLPHNVDRSIADTSMTDDQRQFVCRKRSILAHMDDDRDRRRRARAFAELLQINSELVRRHQNLIGEAERRADEARQGAANAAVAARRDWCFGVYPGAKIRELADQLSNQ